MDQVFTILYRLRVHGKVGRQVKVHKVVYFFDH